MLKNIYITILILIVNINVCVSYQLNLSEFTPFILNKNLLFHNKTYRDEFPTWYGCFLYLNKEDVLINNHSFFAEYNCVKWNPNLNDNTFPIVGKSTFYLYKDNTSNSLYGTPYYFKKEEVLYDIEAFFVNKED